MKKLLFLLFILSSVFTQAQDWAPFKLTDSVQHFTSPNKIPSQSLVNLYQKQIQSVVRDSINVDSFKTTVLLKKGFSKAYNSWSNNNIQIIKGQIFGDTAFIYANSSVFTSIDSFGFKLFFPHQYLLNSSFTLATKANGFYLTARVDSLYTDSIGNSIDSLVKLSISAFDHLNNIDTTGGFHHAEIILSKSNGLQSGFDFTYLKRRIPIEHYYSDTYLITKNRDHQLTTNDEYHSYETWNDFSGTHHLWEVHKITGDTITGNTRTISYRITEKKRLNFNAPTTRTYNTQKSIDITDTVNLFESQIVSDSLLKSNRFHFSVPLTEFSLCQSCGTFNVGYRKNNEYDLSYNFLTQKVDSLLYTNSGLQVNETYFSLGLDDYYHDFYHNGQTAGKRIVYVKYGNQTWGSPLNLTVNIEDLIVENKKKLTIFPNPSQGIFQIIAPEKIASIQVLNLLGQEIKFENKPSAQIDLSGADSGVYFVNVQFEKGSTVTQKVVKQ